MRRLGPEALKMYQQRLDNGFFDKYLSGANVLDIGYRGGDDANVPIVDHAIGIDHDYPNYDGVHLPFPDESQDTVFSSHCYEHISDYRNALREWYRVLRVGGYIVIMVPHKYLYERKSTIPSFFNSDHKRFYTPASLLREFEESLPVNGFRVRHLADNDAGFDYSAPIGRHAGGCYEIELVVQKITRPPHSDLFELTGATQRYVEEANRFVCEIVAGLAAGKVTADAVAGTLGQLKYFPPYEIIRTTTIDEMHIVEEPVLKKILKVILSFIQFDESYYRQHNPDIDAAIKRGALSSGHAHLVAHGYVEGRVFQPDPARLTLPEPE